MRLPYTLYLKRQKKAAACEQSISSSGSSPFCFQPVNSIIIWTNQGNGIYRSDYNGFENTPGEEFLEDWTL